MSGDPPSKRRIITGLFFVQKTGKTQLIFLLILVQSLVAAAAGIIALLAVSQKEIPANVYAGELYVGGMTYDEAVKAIEADYGARFAEGSLRLRKSDYEVFEISFSDIGAAVDGKMTIKQLMPSGNIYGLTRLINAHFSRSGTELKPVVKFDEGRLMMKLRTLSERISTLPADAVIYYKDGLIEKIPDIPGISLNVNNTTELIRSCLESDPFGEVDLNEGDALRTIDAEIKMKDYDDIQVVLGEYSTSIKDPALAEGIRQAIHAVNGQIIAPQGEPAGSDRFSFVGCISASIADPSFDEGYSQVASTLYAALLKAGLPAESITARMPHDLTPDYIEPGLDSWISADGGDLRFSNPYDNPLAIFAVTKGSVLTVAVAGRMEDRTDKAVITRETVQRYTPPVYYVENRELKNGEAIVMDPGKEGITINVYRNGELISTDTYKAETSIVQVAPDVQWENEIK